VAQIHSPSVPIQLPKVPDFWLPILFPYVPSNAGSGLSSIVQPHHAKAFADFEIVLAFH
jgi:hypothetical protein